MPEPHRYILLLAGGSGQRFWPLSREGQPKQVLPLLGGFSLLEDSYARVEALVPRENLFVLTQAGQAEAVRRLLPRLPEAQLLIEPERRDTAAAMAFGAAHIAQRDPDALLAVLPSDHVIVEANTFRHCLNEAWRLAAEERAIVTLGIPPTWPSPSYGYIELGDALPVSAENPDLPPARWVRRFCEKPTPEVAEAFLKTGHFCWNAGMFVVRLPVLRAEFRRQAPEFAAFYDAVAAGAMELSLTAAFGSLPKRSFDYVIMEQAERVLTLPAAFDWDDLGSWLSYGEYLPRDLRGNRIHDRSQTTLEAGRCIVVNRTAQHVALLGVADLVVVTTDDAILIAAKDQVENLRSIVTQLPPALR